LTDIRVILIGGTSHTGKSTLAKHLGQRPSWTHVSTDSLARHPGRPWRATGSVPPHVVRHYSELSDHELLRSVLTHYRNMRPLIEPLVRAHATDETRPQLVLEGSGVWPDDIVSSRVPRVAAIWLVAGPSLIKARIYEESGYDHRDGQGKAMIERFVTRAENYQRSMMERVATLGLASMEVRDGLSLEEIACDCLKTMREIS
jgi:2-phosphoglycerate kinase